MRPPMSSDEDDDYDGFSFGNEFDKPTRSTNANSSQWIITQRRESDEEKKLVLNIKNGDLDGMKQDLLRRYGSESRIKYNDYLKDGWTLLLHAISNLQFHIVTYLLNKGANVNCESGSLTPLMLVCKHDTNASQLDDLVNLAKLLLDHGAVVNVRDQTGYTAFMYACTSGNKAIVDLLFDLSAIDAIDNFGNTPLHYAVENRHFDIVKKLVHAGADTEICNSAGQRPRDVAVSLGLTEIEQLFPEEIIDFTPSAEQYKTYQDLAPLIFADRKNSAYFQDIPRLLRGMRVEDCAKQFYKANISLSDFLTIDDNRLKSIGIEYEYQRKRILLGLLKFHIHPFAPKSIEMVSEGKQKNLYQYFQMYAGYLKHLILIESTIIYLWKIGGMKSLNGEVANEMLASVEQIQKDVISLQQCIHQLSTTSTKNPLFIGPTKNQNQRYKKVLGPFLKYTLMIGMGLFLSYKLIKLVP